MPSARATLFALSLLMISGCIASGTSGFEPDSPVLADAEAFAAYLSDEGLRLEGPEYYSTATPFGSDILSGPILTYDVSSGVVNSTVQGEQGVLRIYPFTNAGSAEASVFPISGGPSIGTRRWTYQNGRLVVVYYGRDASVRGVLQQALGRVHRR